MNVQCPSCQKFVSVGDEYANRELHCPMCGESFVAPAVAHLKEGWFVKTKLGEVGPLDSARIVELARKGDVTPDTELRHSKTNRKVAASTIPGLFPKPDTYDVKPQPTTEISATCPFCMGDLVIDQQYAGQIMTCPYCNREFEAPSSAAASTPAPAPSSAMRLPGR